MEIKLNFWIRYLVPFFLFLFLGALIFLTAQFREPPDLEAYAVVWFFSVIFAIWEGGWFISKQLEAYFPWSRGTMRRLAVHLLLTNLLALFLFNGTFIILNWYENQVLGHLNSLGAIHLAVITAQAFIIAQIINSIQIGYLLLGNWQKAQMEAAQYKQKVVVNRLENIRQNITPQFLLTNFDQLKALIQESPDLVDSYLQNVSSQQASLKETLDTELAHLQESLDSETVADRQNVVVKNQKVAPYKTRFLVRLGTKMSIVSSDQIAGFYKDDIVLLITLGGKKYAIDSSLDELTSKLDPMIFFRISRQCIIHVQAIQEIKPQASQLLLALSVSFPKAVTVSQRNVSKFKRWLDQE